MELPKLSQYLLKHTPDESGHVCSCEFMGTGFGDWAAHVEVGWKLESRKFKATRAMEPRSSEPHEHSKEPLTPAQEKKYIQPKPLMVPPPIPGKK
ncbi:hypothetical protein GMA3_36 [Gordonia phage GMA3]|uniref:Uncharacterized protein n=1 Tax=Gordonia phage GMA3 TaxID=1647284 RepID=A0A0K0NKW3_9CAUD|nr:hypothetical protein AU105_gp036 [Gordonia phage GMA3]AKL88213.1 hypothetical protein GMA3_36 [Gordonia phage GMA3]